MGILLLSGPHWLNHWIIETLKRNSYFSQRLFRADFKVLTLFAMGISFLIFIFSAGGAIRPETALGILFLLPLGFSGILKVLDAKKRKALRMEFTFSLSSLQGLLELGMPFPQALYTLSQFQSAQLSIVLNQLADRFKKGHSIRETCLRLEKKAVSREIAESLEILEIAYHRGASLTPIIQALQSTLESEVSNQEKLDALKKNLWTQAVFAGCMPWGLLFISANFQPELIRSFVNHAGFKGLIAIVCIWEGFGFWAIQKKLSF